MDHAQRGDAMNIDIKASEFVVENHEFRSDGRYARAELWAASSKSCVAEPVLQLDWDDVRYIDVERGEVCIRMTAALLDKIEHAISTYRSKEDDE